MTKGNSQAKSGKGQKQNITPKPSDQIKNGTGKSKIRVQNTRGITQGPQRKNKSEMLVRRHTGSLTNQQTKRETHTLVYTQEREGEQDTGETNQGRQSKMEEKEQRKEV